LLEKIKPHCVFDEETGTSKKMKKSEEIYLEELNSTNDKLKTKSSAFENSLSKLKLVTSSDENTQELPKVHSTDIIECFTAFKDYLTEAFALTFLTTKIIKNKI
jgi:hypothetical protein